MADWFAKLMQRRHAGTSRATPAIGAGEAREAEHAAGETGLGARAARCDALVSALRERDADDRAAREKRQRWYQQSLESDPASGDGAAGRSSPTRLYSFRTTAPCWATPEARALLDELRESFSGGIVTLPHSTVGHQALMLDDGEGTSPRQIGWVEHCVQRDPMLCNVRHQGLEVDTDGGGMLVLRFRYPSTAVTMSSPRDAGNHDMTGVDFAEIRPALDPRPAERAPSPRLVWVTRPEVETMNVLRSRDYETFYVRFKLEVQAGIWSALSALLASAPGSRWHRGSHYSVVLEPDATNRRISQRTVDDGGRAADIGFDRTYDVAIATDILLLYLDGDILADLADICLTLQSRGSADAYFLKEEFFTVIRRFWAGAESLSSCYGSDLAAVVRMAQRALPMPAQAPLLVQDWTNLRQAMVDRYGEGGRKAADIVAHEVHRPRAAAASWPFATFPVGDVNLGLRLVYRQEWRALGTQRGEVVRTIPAGGARGEIVETIIEPGEPTRSLDEIVRDAARATVETMKLPMSAEGSIDTGARALAASSAMGLESECRESSRDTSARLGEIMRRMASRIRVDAPAMIDAPVEHGEPSPSTEDEDCRDADATTRVYSRLQNRYEVLTRAAEIQNVVLVAEKLPAPAEIDLSWVRRHDWILRSALLDDSFRDALETIGQEATTTAEMETRRERLYEHIRANVLHYQRAIWQREDPQQRSMRYRKLGTTLPLEWSFELEPGGALTIEGLRDRLAAPEVEGRFVAYSGGREATIDRLIDPAGPVGYHGNYAVYRMRPEFGSAELFSMLHFFKSPYLRPNPETRVAEVADPGEIAGDHRACALEIALDTSGLVIDVTRAVEPQELTAPKHHDAAPVATEALDEEPPLIAVGESGFALLRSGAAGVADAAWSIVSSRETPAGSLLAGARGPDDRAGVVVAATSGEAPLTANAGVAARDEAARTLITRNDERTTPSVGAGRAHAPGAEWVVEARHEEASRSIPVARARAVRADEPVILGEEEGGRALPLRAGRARDSRAAPLILADRKGTLRLAAPQGAGGGGPHAHERLVLALDDGGLRLIPVAGAGAIHPLERVIFAPDDEWLRPSLFAG